MYIIRGEDGRCRTAVGHSHRGALKKYLDEHPRACGGDWDVKPRFAGQDEWQRFRVR
jgi:hypothetical protein